MTTVSSSYRTFPLRALGAGALAAVGGIAIWVVLAGAAGEERSFAAILIGLLSGYAARSVAQPLWWQVQLAAAAVALPAIFVGQYLAIRQHVITDLEELGVETAVPLFLNPISMATVVFGWLSLYPVDIALWAIALTTAWLIPLNRS